MLYRTVSFFKDYCIFVGSQHMKCDEVIHLLHQSYWAKYRSREIVWRSIRNSRCYGVRDKNRRLVGFARVITDYATTYYLCDVIVEKELQRQGIGKELIRFITEDPDLNGLSGMLVTEHAHGLYEQFGFERDRDRFMRKISD